MFRSTADLKDKKVLVVGLARSGTSSANFLADSGAKVTVNDKKEAGLLGSFIKSLNPAVATVFGSHPEQLFKEADFIVVSPGVPLSIKPLIDSRKNKVPVIGELEFAYMVSRMQQSTAKSDFMAITGTNGKSTTTMLVYEMMRSAGFGTLLGGNIGIAMTDEIIAAEREAKKIDFVVAELSSFQLEAIESFRPKAAAILNITPDHLDRYSGMEEYIYAKCNVAMNQGKDDFLILNADDEYAEKVLERLKAKEGPMPELFYFSRKRKVDGSCYDGKSIKFDMNSLGARFDMDPSKFKIKGVHNIENAMAASLLALLCGCPADTAIKTLAEFSGLEHRLEFVREAGGVKFINDSKGTNVGAVMKSLEGFTEPVILIAGGRDKDGDFSALKHLVREKVKAMVLIGEAAAKIEKALAGATDISHEESLHAAVAKAHALASKGDAVLLSPACASFDMFRDFEDRGRKFKEAVAAL
ncbi:MAG: UDP-N-acetylmuramoyl-L-alanine--D-glutamate ligase [Nitrospirae bacterium]|nr:UDP-N-acetylmuramoyl-L-alanine--D-glutamate ligase [Nitrospirota bacterium]